MDFTDKLAYSGPQPVFSPDSKLMASADGYRLVVRDAASLAVVSLCSCLDRIESISWSPDSDHILCALFKRATVQVFCVSDSDWACNIAEGPAGIVAARWTPDGQHILLTADFGVRLSAWSLVDQSCAYLRGPKHAQAGLAFSPDGSLLAVAHRSDCKDSVAVYDCGSWQLRAQWAPGTSDLADLAWSPDGGCLAVWESALYGHQLGVFTAEGDCLTAYSAYRDLLGIKAVAWSPSGQLLALGDYEQGATVLNHVTWSPLAQFSHQPTVSGPPSVVAYSELEEDTGRRVLAAGTGSMSRIGSSRLLPRSRPGSRPGSRNGSPVKAGPDASQDLDDEGGEMAVTKSRYVVAQLPLRVPVVRPVLDKPNPKLGVGSVSWSFDGSYIATRCDSMPSAVWIWETSRLELASLLLQTRSVRSLQWCPSDNRLVVCTGDSKLYLWTPDGASCVHIPLPGFRASGLCWHPDGGSLVLTSRDEFCCAYF
ncbi:WD repeat-containing protein [Chlorella vulgaris]